MFEGIDLNLYVVIVSLIFIAFDFLTGIIKAIYNKSIDSSIMRDGLIHKTAFVLVMILGALCEIVIGRIDIGITVPLLVPICVYIILTEIASILENIIELNPSLAKSSIFKLFNVEIDDAGKVANKGEKNA